MRNLRKGLVIGLLALALCATAALSLEAPTLAEAEDATATQAGDELAATATESEILKIEPGSVTFDAIEAGTNAAGTSRDITITNISGSPVSPRPFSTEGTFWTSDFKTQTTIQPSESITVKITLKDTSKLAPDDYKESFGMQGVGEGRGQVFVPINLTINKNEIKIESYDAVIKHYGETWDPSKVRVTTDDGGAYTMADFGLTCKALEADAKVTGDTSEKFDVTYTGGGYLTPSNPESLPQLDVTILKTTPVINGLTVSRTVTSGTKLSDVTFDGGANAWNTYSSPRTRVEGTFEWQDPEHIVTMADNGINNGLQAIFKPSDADSFNQVEVKVTLTVQPDPDNVNIQPTLTFDTEPKNIVYDGQEHAFTATTNSGGAVTVSYERQTSTGHVSSGAPRDAGTYRVTATVRANGRYSGASISRDFTISKYKAVISYPDNVKVYGATRVGRTGTYASPYDGNVSYSVTCSGFEAGADVGDHEIKIVPQNANYELSAADKFKVMQATPTVQEVSASPGRAGERLATVQITGTAVNKSANYSPKVDGTFHWANENETLSASKTQYDYVFTPSNPLNFAEVRGKCTVTVTSKNVVDITIDDATTRAIYNGERHHVSATSKTPGVTPVVTYELQSGTYGSEAPVNAGTYNFKVTAAAPDDTYVGSELKGTIVIDKMKPVGQPTVTGSGSTLSNFTFNATTFVGAGGRTVPGSLAWRQPGQTVVPGQGYEWVFTPTDGTNYREASGTIVPVRTADTPVVEKRELGELLLDGLTLMNQAETSADGSDVPPTSMWVRPEVEETLNAAIEHGQRELSNGTATQRHLDHTRTSLEVAMDSYRNSMLQGGVANTKPLSTVSLSTASAVLKPGDAPLEISAGGTGDGAIIAISNNHDIAYCEVSGNSFTVTAMNEGVCDVTVTRAATKTHQASSALLHVVVGERPEGLDDVKPLYRLYNPWSGEHFYTVDSGEWATCKKNGWKDESSGDDQMKLPAWSETPVYRLRNPYTGEHVYTISHDEYKILEGRGWKGENVAFYSNDAESIPMIRLFNPYAEPAGMPGAAHHYTTSANEIETLKGRGYTVDGPSWYGLM